MASREDDFTAFAALASRPLLRPGWLLTGHREQSQDLAQTALTKTYIAWRRVAPGSELAYARRVLVNQHTDWLRRRPWREQLGGATPDRSTTEEPLSAVEDRPALIAALQTLTRRERATVVLRYYLDLSEADAARALGVSVGTVTSVSSRALGKLRSCPLLTGTPLPADARAVPDVHVEPPRPPAARGVR